MNDGDTLLQFAVKHYTNPQCLSVEEFLDDLAKIKHVKRLLNRYKRHGNLRTRLILNHLVIIYSVFDISAANEMMFSRCEKNTWAALKSFLTYLGYLPEGYLPEIKLDEYVNQTLQTIE